MGDYRETIENNDRLLRLYSLYLNERPDFISPEMVHEICAMGLPEEEAFMLLFCEALGLHPESFAEDAAFADEYIRPSVRRLDPAVYRADPYYRSIRIPEAAEGRWQLTTERWEAYTPFVRDDLYVDSRLKELPMLGYFSEPFTFPAVLEDGREWMMVTPSEIETIRPAVEAAEGAAITFGLGLGYYAYMASEKATVTRVAVVEKDETVIRLFQKYILPQFAHGEKVEIIHGDAFEYAEKILPKEHFDHAFADTWHDAQDGVPMYRRFKALEKLSPQTRFEYWVEETLLSYIRREKFEQDPAMDDPYARLSSDTLKRGQSE